MADYTPARLTEIIELTRRAGDPAPQYAILAEGNTSLRTAADRMLVKATGSSMMTADADTFVEVELQEYWDAIDAGPEDDETVQALFARAKSWGAGRPSVESVLHAVCQRLEGVDAVVHTHPIPLLALLSSSRAELLTRGSLFPDQIVVMGRHPLLVPYIDPGLPLARVVSRSLDEHLDRYGERPRVIYLQNHGLFALAASGEEALAITQMAVKSAEVLQAALSVGEPVFLSEAHATRIDTRPDEILRRSMLAE